MVKPYDQLIRALESSTYEQTHTRLRGAGGYSAPGLLCQLYIDAGQPGAWRTMHQKSYSPYFFVHTDEKEPRRGYASVLPSRVANWADLTDAGWYYIEQSMDMPVKFDEIARQLAKFRAKYEA